MVTPDFRRVLAGSSTGLVLAPLVQAYLMEAKFPDEFSVVFRKAGAPRPPDDWFHPSTHPTMSARQLYYYLAEPDRWEVERLSYESRMAVTMGTAVHSFIETCLLHAGWLLKPTGTCVNCQRQHGSKNGQCNEWGAIDKELGRRGHMDGLLSIEPWGKGVFELKTTNERSMGQLRDNDIEGFKAKWPGYYAQVQDYMDMTGYRKALVLVMVLGYPWRPIEFQINYDEAFCSALRGKYRLVREHVLMRTPPPIPCCKPKSVAAKNCQAQTCPIKQVA